MSEESEDIDMQIMENNRTKRWNELVAQGVIPDIDDFLDDVDKEMLKKLKGGNQ